VGSRGTSHGSVLKKKSPAYADERPAADGGIGRRRAHRCKKVRETTDCD
jgi:hypothetical protein